MNKKSRNNNEIIDLIELSNDITRFLKDDQYLVTLKIRRRRKARRTEKPNDPPLTCDQMTSNIDPQMTTQSKRLNEDSKYILGPSAYILTNISIINSPRNTYSVQTKIKLINKWGVKYRIKRFIRIKVTELFYWILNEQVK